MPIARFQMPDGRIARFEVPEGTTPEQAQAMIADSLAQQPQPAAPPAQATPHPAPSAQPVTVMPPAKGWTPAQRQNPFVRGLRDPLDAGAQLLEKALPSGVASNVNRLNNWLADKTGLVARVPEGGVDQMVRDRERAYQEQRAASGEEGIDWSRMAGNVLNPANIAVASRIPQAATLAGRVALGAGTGAMFGAAQPVAQGDFWSEKSKQAALGAALGGIMPAVTGGIARVISPNASRNPDLEMLRAAGVSPTIGQTLGGATNTIEQKATSLPLVGEAITAARKRSFDDFNRAALNRTVAPIGETVSDVGHAGITQAGDKISAAYTEALKGLKGVTLDGQAAKEIATLHSMASNLPGPARDTFNRTMKNVVESRMSPAKGMAAETFKIVESELSQKASAYGGSSVASEQELGRAFSEALRILRENAARQNPRYADALSKANAAWANLVRVEGAGKSAALNEGVFTPGQLMSAVRQSDKSVRDRATARGTALMQDIAGAGQRVLGNTYPDSGTAGRAALMATGAAGMANLPLTLAAIGGGAAAYTPTMQKLLVNIAATRPYTAKALADAVRNYAPYLTSGTAPVGYNMLNPPK